MRRPGATEAEVTRGFLVLLLGDPSWRLHFLVPRQGQFGMGWDGMLIVEAIQGVLPSDARLCPPRITEVVLLLPLSLSNHRPALSNFFSSLLCVVGYFVPLDLFNTGRRGRVSPSSSHIALPWEQPVPT
jgi:hypothetical protein